MSIGIPAPAYRLPDATRLGAVRVAVSDLSQSIRFYTGVLGLSLLARAGRTAALGIAESGVTLLHLESHGIKRPLGPRLGLYHVALLVPDRAALGRFFTHVAGQGVKVASADHAVSEALYLWDPDHLGIEVYRDRPRHEWRTNGNEVLMTTEPLNIGEVLNAADAPWQGMAAGTVLGHLHLQVDDLDRAAGFYHRALGFDKMVWSYPGALFMAAGGYHHHLGANTWAANARRRGPDEAGLLAWEVVVPTTADLGAAAESCARAGAVTSETDDSVAVVDPWGVQVLLRRAVSA